MGGTANTKSSSKTKRAIRDAEATKQQILDAAEVEFAKLGLFGARTEAIANSAKVAPRMIYYYFQSKEGLYQAVLQRPATQFQQILEQLNLEQLPAPEALRIFLQTIIAYEISHRYRGMLLFQEANQNQGKYFQLTSWQEPIGYITQILEKGMQEGVFCKLDPYMTTLTIAGVCVFYANAYENLKHLTPDVELLSSEMIEQYTQAAVNLVLKGVLSQ
ncbi:TetR/AcrR family transcriptional regulator [Brasilonema octagenarum UFV-E1]|uniref:TetR/AcrR family transcriptional regulator n=2 Tax=Brasilonema TaxID=383614 RepID=A0A856M9T5_9CYAN|nr:TetR/AcrR family transcriptional regulator [Brasilonema sennae]NMF66631.1 TetR/AcrR family transcriptional regulator [Brasilonema octagenarum UFV-OR1]QDL07110.1 TetR/AcrR family transcriptional regulator [Brasilonema sennae CENA114]QDL13474.1 TetR/AcrR family transcriptional regulator [Brasilonema octagenarum UFV-E1]